MTALNAPAPTLLLPPPERLATPDALAAGVNREAAERVLQYLVFHRSLLGEGDGAERMLERYLSLVQNLKEGVHIIIPDPFQKATALLFELVLDAEFDPWEIDLVRFTQLYVERVRTEPAIDFAVAGRLLFMAWSILYLQSEEVLKSREPPPPPESPLDLAAAGEESYLESLDSPEAMDVTSAVLGSTESSPLEQMVRHTEHRPVSLLELVQAFGEAEEQARRQLKIQELRERLRAEQRAPPEVLVHGDIPERDLADVWGVARGHPVGEPFPFLAFWRKEEGRDRLVAVFLASLFLSREGVIDLKQKDLSERAFEVVRLTDARPEPKEA